MDLQVGNTQTRSGSIPFRGNEHFHYPYPVGYAPDSPTFLEVPNLPVQTGLTTTKKKICGTPTPEYEGIGLESTNRSNTITGSIPSTNAIQKQKRHGKINEFEEEFFEYPLSEDDEDLLDLGDLNLDVDLDNFDETKMLHSHSLAPMTGGLNSVNYYPHMFANGLDLNMITAPDSLNGNNVVKPIEEAVVPKKRTKRKKKAKTLKYPLKLPQEPNIWFSSFIKKCENNFAKEKWQLSYNSLATDKQKDIVKFKNYLSQWQEHWLRIYYQVLCENNGEFNGKKIDVKVLLKCLVLFQNKPRKREVGKEHLKKIVEILKKTDKEELERSEMIKKLRNNNSRKSGTKKKENKLKNLERINRRLKRKNKKLSKKLKYRKSIIKGLTEVYSDEEEYDNDESRKRERNGELQDAPETQRRKTSDIGTFPFVNNGAFSFGTVFF